MRNYFNYFTEVEEHFVRKRGKHVLVSPLDWCLIELWKENGIPLHVVLRGIDRSFESAEKRQRKSPGTLFYCHPAIIEAFGEYRASMIGSAEQPTEPGSSREGLQTSDAVAHLDHLLERVAGREGEACARVAQRLTALSGEIRNRASVEPGQLEVELSGLEALLVEGLLREISAERIKDLKAEVTEETKIYKKHLKKEMYDRLRANYLHRKVLAEAGLPEFTLLAG